MGSRGGGGKRRGKGGGGGGMGEGFSSSAKKVQCFCPKGGFGWEKCSLIYEFVQTGVRVSYAGSHSLPFEACGILGLHKPRRNDHEKNSHAQLPSCSFAHAHDL